jgi:tetratricopeptide (TPR) repeat protein
MDAGMMPALESLVNNGVMGNLATLDPPLSPMLWTTISTGKYADQHGILGFTEPAPEGNGVRPCMITSRKVKAIWNMLSQSGYKTHQIGWWPSHPAEPINGISISNFYHKAEGDIHKPWKMIPGTVHPHEKSGLFRMLRIHPAELTEAHVLPFVPNAAKVDQEKDKHLQSIQKITAECSTIHAAATWILENEEWDFLAVYYDAIDHYCHGFMKFHPPKMGRVKQEMFDMYKDVVRGGYIYHDMMLSRLLQLAGDDVTVMLVSDHGFHSDHLRPKGIPKEPAGPAWEHRNYGIVCMKGPGIKKDELIFGSSLLDVAPTVLALFGLPPGKDMPGKPLVQAFEENLDIERIESWEEIDGACGMHPKDWQSDPWAEQQALEQLIELGYIDKPGEDKQKNIERTVNESNFYLARVYMFKNECDKALPILEKLQKDKPEEVRFSFYYAKCLSQLGRIDEANIVVEGIITREKKEYPQLLLLQGSLAFSKGDHEAALHMLMKAEKSDPRLPTLHFQIGNVYLKMGNIEAAQRAFTKAITIDPDSAQAHNGLAETYLRKKMYDQAVDSALTAVGLLYHMPQAHINLGIALARLKRFDHAIEAFEVSLKILPHQTRAHRYLSHIYRTQLHDPQKAEKHAAIIKEFTKKKDAATD